MHVGGDGGVEAIVVDIGSSSARIGYAGEDNPRVWIPSDLGVLSNECITDPYLRLSSGLDPKLGQMKVKNPLSRAGLVQDWDAIETLYESASKTLSMKPQEHSVMLSEPSQNTRALREKFTELLFEKYDVPAVFISKSSVLSCYANGRSTGLVVDVGANQSSVVPVQDGFALQKNITLSSVGGNVVDEYLYELLGALLEKQTKGKLKHVRAQVEVKTPVKTSSSQQNGDKEHHFSKGSAEPASITLENADTLMKCRLQAIRQLKEAICRVSDVEFDETANTAIPTVPYELPDGTTVYVGCERFKAPEILFVTQQPKPEDDSVSPSKNPSVVPDHMSLQKMVYDSANMCDMDLRRDLFSNVILTGGCSCVENLPVRLERSLGAMVPATFKLKVVASHPSERKLSAWLGGSILASLGSFHEMWLSKSEYAEHGASLVQRKCP